MNLTDSSTMAITLDIAAILGAIIWPVILLALLFIYRKNIPSIFKWLSEHVSKIQFPGISLELALARPFTPDWTESPGALDLRRKATFFQVNDTAASTFIAQMSDDKTADYAEIDLGTGEEWFSSRLFIMAIIFAQLKGIECFIFVEKIGSRTKQYAGWADPKKIREAFIRKQPWLEQAYATAWATIMSQVSCVITRDGKKDFNFPQKSKQSIELLNEFLKEIQKPSTDDLVKSEPQEWIAVEDAMGKNQLNTHEHTSWVTVNAIEDILGNDYHRAFVRSSDLRARTKRERFWIVLSMPDRFVPVIAEDGRLENLIDSDVLLREVGKKILTEMEEGNE